MSAADVQTPAALPSELNYALPASLPAGETSFFHFFHEFV
jgi:hypothetical protein